MAYVNKKVPLAIIRTMPAAIRKIRPVCPTCAGPMSLRMRRKDKAFFWSCNKWRKENPGCRGASDFTRWMDVAVQNEYARQLGGFIQYGTPLKVVYAPPLTYADRPAPTWGQITQVLEAFEREIVCQH